MGLWASDTTVDESHPALSRSPPIHCNSHGEVYGMKCKISCISGNRLRVQDLGLGFRT